MRLRLTTMTHGELKRLNEFKERLEVLPRLLGVVNPQLPDEVLLEVLKQEEEDEKEVA